MTRSRAENINSAIKLIGEARTMVRFGAKEAALRRLENSFNLYLETAWADTAEQRAKTEKLYADARRIIEEQ